MIEERWRYISFNLQVLRLLKTSVPQQSAKTPIQEWGWEYLLRQRALKRPISPHLAVYKPQVPWMVSGFHRITGCVMAGIKPFFSTFEFRSARTLLMKMEC